MLKIMFRSAVILAVMAMICSCYQLTKRSSTVNRTEKLINKYLRDNNIVLDSTNTFTINLEEVLGIQYDSLLTFDAFDTCSIFLCLVEQPVTQLVEHLLLCY